jgi:hypothetical protein
LISHDHKTTPTPFAIAQQAAESGLIIVPQDLDIGDIGLAIENLPIVWAASDAEEWKTKLVSCRPNGSAPTPVTSHPPTPMNLKKPPKSRQIRPQNAPITPCPPNTSNKLASILVSFVQKSKTLHAHPLRRPPSTTHPLYW